MRDRGSETESVAWPSCPDVCVGGEHGAALSSPDPRLFSCRMRSQQDELGKVESSRRPNKQSPGVWRTRRAGTVKRHSRPRAGFVRAPWGAFKGQRPAAKSQVPGSPTALGEGKPGSMSVSDPPLARRPPESRPSHETPPRGPGVLVSSDRSPATWRPDVLPHLPPKPPPLRVPALDARPRPEP